MSLFCCMLLTHQPLIYSSIDKVKQSLLYFLLLVEQCFARFFEEVGVLSLTVLVQCLLGWLTSNSELSISDSSSLLLLPSLEADVDGVLASPNKNEYPLGQKYYAWKKFVIRYVCCQMWKWCISFSYYFWISCWQGLLAQKQVSTVWPLVYMCELL